MEYRIVISRRGTPDTPIAELQKEASNISWDINRIGGNGAFRFDVSKKLFRDLNTELGANVKFYLKESGTYTLRYQGRVQSKAYSVRGNSETVSFSGFGYQVELDNIYIDRDYASTEVSLIVADILDNDITPNTNISYLSSTGIDSTSFTPDSVEFNTKALSAFQTLAEIVGTREWGVDHNRNFYFKERSSAVGFRIPIGQMIESIGYDISEKDIANRIVIIGGDVSDSPFTRVVNDTSSQLKWNRRDEVIQNSAIVTNAVADQFGAARLAEFKNTMRRVRFSLVGNTIYEDSIPIDLIQLKTDVDTYGTKKYLQGIYNDLVSLRINRISYSLNSEGVLSTSLDLGQLRPDISESISQLDNQIKQLQSVGV